MNTCGCETCDCLLYVSFTNENTRQEGWVKLGRDGSVSYGGAYTPCRADEALWEAIAQRGTLLAGEAA